MTSRRKAFAVTFSALHVWSAASYFDVSWKWPREHIKPLGTALKARRVKVDKTGSTLSSLKLITLHFDGAMEARNLRDKEAFAGSLFEAKPGDVVYSKIDVRNGAIGVVTEDLGIVAVSSEFPVYEVDSSQALPQYVQLLFRTPYFRRAINSMVSGASGRKRVQPSQLVSVHVPLPPIPLQSAIVQRWREAKANMDAAMLAVQRVKDELNSDLYTYYYKTCNKDILPDRYITVPSTALDRWDVKTARAAAFRRFNPSLVPLSDFAEEATELVRPWEKPETDFAVYGVSNKSGVFFSHFQKGADFNAPYKRIQEGWFFHNPTRSSVGSLGLVPSVLENAVTSPEYQVWRTKAGAIEPGYIASLISTAFFISLVQFHRVGAVKQRLYVENLLEIRVPPFASEYQSTVALAREKALEDLAASRIDFEKAERETEDAIMGNRSIE